MTDKAKYKCLRFFIVIVWIVNGLLCKVLDLVPRHQQIVATILGNDNARSLTIIIGILEICMAIWILSNLSSRLNAITQILIIAAMNALEYTLVPDLLLWGKANAVFAVMFIFLIYYNEFHLHRKLTEQA